MAEYDIIVVGAGISGLSFAHYCARAKRKVLVLEKSNQAGGALHSHKFNEAQSFWIEMGAHTCYNSYGNLLGILEDDGLVNQLVSRQKAPFKLLIDSQVKSIPSQLNLLALLPAVLRLFTSKKEGKTVEDYYSRLAGRGNYDKVLSHVFNAVASQPAGGFPADMLFKPRRRRKDVLRKFTFSGGLQTIIDTVAARPNIDLLTGTTITGLEAGASGIAVATTKGVYEAKNLALATPASTAAELTATTFPKVSQALARTKVNKIESVGVAVNAPSVPLERFATLIAIDDLFYSVVSRDIVPDENYRGFTFHFKPDVADERTKLKRISDVLKVGADELTFVYVKNNYVPALTINQRRIVAEIDSLAAGKNLYLNGNYFLGLAIEDCVSRSLAEFKRFMG